MYEGKAYKQELIKMTEEYFKVGTRVCVINGYGIIDKGTVVAIDELQNVAVMLDYKPFSDGRKLEVFRAIDLAREEDISEKN